MNANVKVGGLPPLSRFYRIWSRAANWPTALSAPIVCRFITPGHFWLLFPSTESAELSKARRVTGGALPSRWRRQMLICCSLPLPIFLRVHFPQLPRNPLPPVFVRSAPVQNTCQSANPSKCVSAWGLGVCAANSSAILTVNSARPQIDGLVFTVQDTRHLSKHPSPP